MSIKINPTWKDVDEIINLRTTDGEKVSLAELEKALADNDLNKLRDLVTALRSKTPEYEADVYLFGRVRLTLYMLICRIEASYKQASLIKQLYLWAKNEKAYAEKRSQA